MSNVAVRQNFDADVIIAGAGPAGAAAACHLARLGASVIVLDRAAFPRDKVCGDFVGPSGLGELELLGVSAMEGYAQTNIGRRAAVYLDGKELISQLFPEIPGQLRYGRVIPRLKLDHLLVQAAAKAGARIMDGFPLIRCATDENGATVVTRGPNGEFSLRARLLIGADGSASAVARTMRGGQTPRRDRIVATRAYFTNVEGPEDQLDLYFSGDCFPGYYWLFPTGRGEANVGLGLALETLPAHKETPAAMLRRLMREDKAMAARLRNAKIRGNFVGWPLNTYNHAAPVVGARVMLIGDAAGLINPLNGEGIQYALLSARWAAETLAAPLRDGDFSQAALAPYAARVEEELRFDMALARVIVHMITNRALTPVWLEALKIIARRARRDPDYARIAAGILAGLTPAREALSRKMIGGTIDQALSWLAREGAFVAFGGPRAWAGSALDFGQIGFGLAYDAATDPSGFADWLKGAASGALELGYQAARDAVAVRMHGSDALPPPPEPARLSI